MAHGRTERGWVAGTCDGIAENSPGLGSTAAWPCFLLGNSVGHCLLSCDNDPGEHRQADRCPVCPGRPCHSRPGWGGPGAPSTRQLNSGETGV